MGELPPKFRKDSGQGARSFQIYHLNSVVGTMSFLIPLLGAMVGYGLAMMGEFANPRWGLLIGAAAGGGLKMILDRTLTRRAEKSDEDQAAEIRQARRSEREQLLKEAQTSGAFDQFKTKKGADT